MNQLRKLSSWGKKNRVRLKKINLKIASIKRFRSIEEYHGKIRNSQGEIDMHFVIHFWFKQNFVELD